MHLQYSQTQTRDDDMINLATKILSQGFIEITMIMQEDLKVSESLVKSIIYLFCVLYAYIESVQMHTHGYSIFIRAAVSKKTDNFHAGLEKSAFH